RDRIIHLLVSLCDRLFCHTHAEMMCRSINKHSSFYETLLKNQIIKGIFFLLHFIPDYSDATHPFNIMMHNNIMK
ncbi:hypothetical protein, partial [Escherichia coli]|uniref:hypothetical protein n=1 Tax=Escherichia coli TaxID=562 RepID=UPI001BFC43B7